MASSYLRTLPPPPASPPLATLSRARSFGTLASASRTGGGGRVTKEEVPPPHLSVSGSLSSSRTQLDLFESTRRFYVGSRREGNFSIPLGKNLKKVSEKFLTVSQKRNIKGQAFLGEVSQRSDSVFFATIGAFVILPPFVILGIAVLTGYVQLFP